MKFSRQLPFDPAAGRMITFRIQGREVAPFKPETKSDWKTDPRLKIGRHPALQKGFSVSSPWLSL
jgi:hypothetical protein